MYATYSVLFLGAAALLWWLLTYNQIIAARNAADQAWSNIEVELKRRLDLIDNLVEVVRGYAKHESQTLQNVVAAREQLAPATSAAQANQDQPGVNHVMRQLVAVIEAYPELRADAQFRNLGAQLTDTENRIAERRHAYNAAANAYLILKQSFPSNLVTAVHEFPDRAFFDAPDDLVDKPPAIKFT